MTKIDENKCVGCGICANICPEGIEIAGGKARIKNENADCLKDAANACPRRAIIFEGRNEKTEPSKDTRIGFNQGFEQRMGQGRRIGSGRGRGLGRGPRNGRGMGRGRGDRGR